MTEHNKPSLTQLYRRFAGGSASVPNAEDLLELARLQHAEDAASPLYADLLRLSRALEPASAQLGSDLKAACDQDASGAHRRTVAPRRAAHVARRWRGVGAIAASLLAVVGAWTLQRAHVPAPQQATNTVALVATAPVSDRIFAFGDERSVALVTSKDEIFRDQFSSDEIFHDQFASSDEARAHKG